jgi:hypothetical protein
MRGHPRMRPGAARRETSPSHFRKPGGPFRLAVWHLAFRATRASTRTITRTTTTATRRAAAARARVCDEPGSPRAP